MKYVLQLIGSFVCIFAVAPASVAATAVPEGAVWKFFDDGVDPGDGWNMVGFDDSAWGVGAGQLGYGDDDESTLLASSQIAYYFRHFFTVDGVLDVDSATLRLLYDDGAIVFLNGVEIHRTPLMPNSGEVAFDQPASSYTPDNSIAPNIDVPASLLSEGANLLAVQVHNHSTNSSDISFDLSLELESAPAGSSPGESSSSGVSQIRLVWVDDPSATVTVGWTHGGGADAMVHYGTADGGQDPAAYPLSAMVARTAAYSGGGLVSQFARLSGLQPDTAYYFVLSDEAGVSPRYWFRTAADTPRAFSFIAGGDSRNNRTPRQKANRMVAKLRPLFVAFTGDMIDSDSAAEWSEWLDDWQLTVSEDGRMYPLLPHRGNHESRGNSTIYDLFDTTPDNYYGLTFGGGLLRYYVLNSESGEAGQADWMQADLDALGGPGAFTHLTAGYHKPMRPHTSGKTNGTAEYDAWAQLFYDNGFDLVFESDSHVMKRTLPLKPSVEEGHDEGFVVDLLGGTVYVGEGSWGAPRRRANDAKSWTADWGSFDGFDLIHVYRQHMELYTVQVDDEAASGALVESPGVLSLPEGIPLWEPPSGARLTIGGGAEVPLSFSRFQMEAFPASGGVPAGSGAWADFDGDGVNNFSEFAHALDPATAEPGSVIAERLPHFTLHADGMQNLDFRRRTGSTLVLRVETSDALTAWGPLAESVDYDFTVDPGTGSEDVSYEMIGEKAERDRAFFRVIAEE